VETESPAATVAARMDVVSAAVVDAADRASAARRMAVDRSAETTDDAAAAE